MKIAATIVNRATSSAVGVKPGQGPPLSKLWSPMPPFTRDIVHSNGVMKVGLCWFWHQWELKPRTTLIAVRPAMIMTGTATDERSRRNQ